MRIADLQSGAFMTACAAPWPAPSSYPQRSEGHREAGRAGRLAGMIDLHTHTLFSDGSQTPTQLVEEAAAKGLTAIAVTDHDTVDGLPEALAAGERLGVEVIPGVEINLEHDRVTMDMLGLLPRRASDRGAAEGARRAARVSRGAKPAHGRAPGRARPAARPRGPRRRRRERRRRAAAHRRGHGAPRVRRARSAKPSSSTSAAAPPPGWTAAGSPWAAPSSCCARRAPSPCSRTPASSAPTPPA